MDNQLASTPRATEIVLDDVNLEVHLGRVVEFAREQTGARYAALCVLNDARDGLARFITVGIRKGARSQIGMVPRGRGVLGDLILGPVPLRLANVREHPRFYGFPAGHPPMRSFLGVPILVSGTPIGSLYVTEKAGGQPFTGDDEESVVTLAEFASRAIDHARHGPSAG